MGDNLYYPYYNGSRASGPGTINMNGSNPYSNQQAGSGNGFNILNKYTPNGKGGMDMQQGYGGLALGAFNAWNAYNQGNKMYDLQKEAFDFSKDQFNTNFNMQRDVLNRQINRDNKMAEKWAYANANPGATGAQKGAHANQMYDKYQDHGDSIQSYRGDGSYNITDAQGNQMYATQDVMNPVSATGGQFADSGFVDNTDYVGAAAKEDFARNYQPQNNAPAATMESTNPNADTNTDKSKPVAAKDKNVASSPFNKKKIIK